MTSENMMIIMSQIKKRLGANYVSDTDDVIVDIINDLMIVATSFSNRDENDKKIIPYLKKAVISEYLARGAEGLLSKGEGSLSSTFNDIEKKLRLDISTVRRLP